MAKNVREGKNRDVIMQSILNDDDNVDVDVVAADISSWELVDPSSDEDDGYSYNESDLDDEENEVSKDPQLFGSPSSDISSESLPEQLNLQMYGHGLVLYENNSHDRDVAGKNDMYVGGDEYDEQEDEDGYDDYDVDEEEEFDLDDELVPKWVTDRFGRQRMRKLGKRVHSKMNKSKRGPYLYNRPGCVRGKHGLGLKHNLIG